MDILELAVKIDNEFKARESEIQKESTLVSKEQKKLDKKKRELKAFQKDFDIQKKEIEALILENKKIELKIRREELVKAAELEVANQKELFKKMRKELTESQNDVIYERGQISKRERALAKKESEYKNKIERELAAGVIKNFIKGK